MKKKKVSTGIKASNTVSLEDYKKKKGKGKTLSPGEEAMAWQLTERGFIYEREVKLIPGRDFRVDFFLKVGQIPRLVVIEIEGKIWGYGRHSRGQGWLDDAFKYNTLTMLGYYVYRFATHQVVDGKGRMVTEAMDWLTESGVLPK